ncbi:DUF1593 domain-containing protein [Granulosicoccaceae sp. 1_MG-2023]|nr:DUF1593 domain-containing protein [Granulosicoccaceae sp. 1_MG-2023]
MRFSARAILAAGVLLSAACVSTGSVAEISPSLRTSTMACEISAEGLNPDCGVTPSGGALNGERYRVLITTDVPADTDDIQSLVHYLLVSDLFDLQGLISSPPTFNATRELALELCGSEKKTACINRVLDKYAQDYPNLRTWSGNYPAPDILYSLVKEGHETPWEQAGQEETEGSRWIVQQALSDDPRPLYIHVWGTVTNTATALLHHPEIADRIRVIMTGWSNVNKDQAAYDYIRENFPQVFFIEAEGTMFGVRLPETDDYDNESLCETISQKGAMGAYWCENRWDYVDQDFVTMYYMLAGDPENPAGESWGGTYENVGGNRWKDSSDPAYRAYIDVLGREADGVLSSSQWRTARLDHLMSLFERTVQSNPEAGAVSAATGDSSAEPEQGAAVSEESADAGVSGDEAGDDSVLQTETEATTDTATDTTVTETATETDGVTEVETDTAEASAGVGAATASAGLGGVSLGRALGTARVLSGELVDQVRSSEADYTETPSDLESGAGLDEEPLSGAATADPAENADASGAEAEETESVSVGSETETETETPETETETETETADETSEPVTVESGAPTGESGSASEVSADAQVAARDMFEISLQGSDPGETFDADFSLQVTFTLPDGTQRQVDGFRDGDGLYRARAYAAQTGLWRWESASSESELDGKSGAFEVISSDLPGKLRKHVADPYQFQYDNGDWFLHLGDTAYRWVNFAEADWQEYLEQADQVGFNKLRVWFNHGRYDVQALFNDDRTGLNLDYWQEIDRRLQWASANYPHIQFQLIPYGEDSDEINRYEWDELTQQVAREAQARFSALPNVQWCIVNDRELLASGTPAGDRQVLASSVDRIGSDMAAREAWGTLLTSHQARWEGYSFVDADWSDIITLEDLDQVGGDLIRDYRSRSDADPVINEEDRYELYRGAEHPDYFFRRLFWGSLLAGGHATYGGLETYVAGSEAGDTNGIIGYYDSASTSVPLKGADQLRYIPQFFEQSGLTLVGFAPAQSQVHADSRDAVAASKGTTMLVYVANPDGDSPEWDAPRSDSAAVSVTLPDGLSSANLRWYNVRSGEWGGETTLSGEDVTLTTPGGGDWLALITP